MLLRRIQSREQKRSSLGWTPAGQVALEVLEAGIQVLQIGRATGPRAANAVQRTLVLVSALDVVPESFTPAMGGLHAVEPDILAHSS